MFDTIVYTQYGIDVPALASVFHIPPDSADTSAESAEYKLYTSVKRSVNIYLLSQSDAVLTFNCELATVWSAGRR